MSDRREGGQPIPEGYLGADARVTSGPAPELVAAGYALEVADGPLLHRGLTLADLAHVLALEEAGAIPREVARRLLATLIELLDVPAEEFPYDVRLGDAYNSRERELERRLGSAAGWVHTGRTRREAGRISFRLVLRSRLLRLHEAVIDLARCLSERADELADAIWADMTYLQPAQPSTFGHYLGGFAEETTRHLDRLEAAYRWADRSPAGVGGVSGTRVPLSRGRLAELLGFGAVGAHARDAMWAVDGLVESVVAATQAVITADRLAEDLEVLASTGFGYVALDASLCRASVLMPQKRNPYALAVIRGGANVLVGRSAGMLATARTPSARTDNWLYSYGETAEALELANRLVALTSAVVRTLDVDRGALAARAGEGFTAAADLTELIALKGDLDYRSAYRLVGRAVRSAIEAGRTNLSPADLTEAGRQLGLRAPVTPAEMAAALDPEQIVAARTGAGSATPRAVHDHQALVRERLELASAWNAERRAASAEAEQRLLETARRGAAPATSPAPGGSGRGSEAQAEH